VKRIIEVGAREKRIEQRTNRKRAENTPAAAAGGGTH